MWNGTKVKPVNTCTILAVNPKNGEKFKVRFTVVRESDTSACFSITEKMKLLTLHKGNFLNILEKSNNDLLLSYPDVFDGNSLGTRPGIVALQVDPNCKPVSFPVYKVHVSVWESSRRSCKGLKGSKSLVLWMSQPTG